VASPASRAWRQPRLRLPIGLSGVMAVLIGLLLAVPIGAFLLVSVTPRLFDQGSSWFTLSALGEALSGPSLHALTDSALVGVGAAVLALVCALPLAQIQNAPDDRVATAALSAVFGAKGAVIMAIAIIISTFGCNNGLILAGSRVAYAMAKDGLFFKATGKLNDKGVPGTALVYQGIWIIVLILLRTRNADGTYGNLYSDLLDYVIFSALLFYVLTIGGIFVLRWKRPEIPRPYRCTGYPWLPSIYVLLGTWWTINTIVERPKEALAGTIIVLVGVPGYMYWKRQSRRRPSLVD